MKRDMRTFTVSFTVTDCSPTNDDRDIKTLHEIIYNAFDNLEYDFEIPVTVVEKKDATPPKDKTV